MVKIKELGHVVLYVCQLGRSVAFYKDILGFPLVAKQSGMAVFSSGRTHHELLLIEVGGKSRKKEVEPGLYHIGLKIGNSDEELKKAYQELEQKGVTIIGASDHGISHSLYILDPDDNEIELYVDVSDEWKKNPMLVLSPIKRLKLD